MAAYESRRCYSCSKIFCCVDCCENHIKKKHSAHPVLADCPLCRREPLTVRSFDQEQLKNHVIFNHLPLQCLKCGELFEKHEDLKSIGTCDRHPIIRVEPPTLTEACVTSLSSSSLDLASSGIAKTPSNSSIQRKSLSFSGDYRQFEDSPREFTRHTSTPMQVGLTKQLNLSNASASGRSGNFFFKTPKRPHSSTAGYLADKSSEINNQDNGSAKFSSHNSEQTPLRSILSSKSFKDSNHSSSLFRNISERRLEVMMELNGEADSNPGRPQQQEADSLEAVELRKSRRDSRDSNKRVRFSDEFDFKPENEGDAEAEEFFESCQSFSDASITSTEKINLISDDNNNNVVGNYENPRVEPRNLDAAQAGTSGSSSRVIMMVLVEKSGEVYPRELAPIIDSSLEKLRSAITFSNTELASAGRSELKDSETGFRMLSVDSYTKVSTVECGKNLEPSSSCLLENQPARQNGTGIFASVANAVKNVFKNISGSSKATSLQPKSPESILQDSSSLDSCESAITSLSRAAKRPREEIEFIPAGSSYYSSDSSLKSGSGNKSPDYFREDKTASRDVRSPAVKKARGWYKQIRPRKPISRMKNNLPSPPLPRGVSFETQSFAQGALSIKGAVLPLPDRAQVNQSTQTDF